MKIAGKEYSLKYTLRSLIVFEELTGASFKPGLLKDEITLYYSILAANNPGIELTFNQFFDALERDKRLLQGFRDWLENELKGQFLKDGQGETEESGKKKE
jgi:hypothetical protein